MNKILSNDIENVVSISLLQFIQLFNIGFNSSQVFTNLNLDSNVPANENLLKMLDAQVSLLKQQSNNQYNKLINSNPNFSKKQINYPFTIEEPSVATNFMAANDNRVQKRKKNLNI